MLSVVPALSGVSGTALAAIPQPSNTSQHGIPCHKTDTLSKSSQENLTAGSSASDEDQSEESDVWAPLPISGVLSKWTNLLHGWQERYFVLSDGTLTYYRSEDEIGLGSRGSVRIRTAFVKPHEYDDCRFEVRVGELIWYLRGTNSGQRQSWIAAIERHRVAESGYGSERTLHRPSSLMSLNSGHSPSIASASSYKWGHRLREKLAEMETFKEILCKQVDSLQAYFDACSAAVQHSSPDRLEDWLKDDDHQTPSDELDSLEDRDSLHRYLVHQKRGSNLYCGRSMCEDHLCLDHKDTSNPPFFKSEEEVTLLNHSSQPDTPPTELTVEESNTCASRQGTPTVKPTTNAPTSGGFFSRFLPSFRSSSSTQPVAVKAPQSSDADQLSTEHLPCEQPRPSCRFNDIQRILKQHGAHAPDFRGESHMFKATAVGILTNLSHTIELMVQHEEQWRKRLEREAEKRRRLEETQRAMAQEMAHLRHLIGLSSVSHSNSATALWNPFMTSGSAHFGGHARLKSCGQLELRHLHAGLDSTGLSHGPAPPQTPVTANRTLFNLVGPDFEEGPNSVIRDEEFYDAIDAESDRIEQDAARLAALKSVGKLLRSAQAMPTTHPLHAELEQAVTERIRNFANTDAFQPPGQQLQPLQHHPSGLVDTFGQSDDGTQTIGDWQVVTQDGDMIIYKREVETEDGVVLDPLQAVHTVPGVTAREICTYFWDVQYRMDWEFTVDRPPTVLEVCGDDTVVLHQVYKRVWPTTQRDSLFWSHLRQVSVPFQSSSEGNGPVTSDRVTVLDSWMVVNMSTDYLSEKIAESSTPMIRLGLDVVLFCQTVIDSSVAITHNVSIDSLPRDRLRTRLVYVANINPGGWVPAAGLRTLARREYPRFLKRFSAYVQEQTREKTALF
ncbi:hypothetical protein T265_10410 [Opisthorchis viverrini]|uniref:Collagen type IV alpha-3-binding protein n=1 Tax=Opisthorchis viverrini TaxID=6198 RepID=A0A074Z6Q0_OPIVI|nr:hypothetical protein T265_10410 [Opisthorchis viverrini]KER21222.1 hypothetical protein T265_10410 [Opisthorchis viverrini]